MNRPLLFLSLLFTTVFISGCVKAEYHLIIHEDGSAEVELFTGISEMMAGFMENEDFYDQQLIEDGYTLTEEARNGYSGMKATKLFSSLNDVELPISDEEDPMTIHVQEKIFSKQLNLFLEWSGRDLTEQQQSYHPLLEGIDETMAESFDLSFKVTLPESVKMQDHNASRIEENTYIWDLSLLTDQTIALNSELPKPIPYLYITVAIAIVIVLFIIVLVIRKREQK
ncbi:hypothetical protein [Bacillus sp. JCM 19034]|uniref:hypothetical protein n=1 Tax=Bacillus sp. JCM 19034 TaxID=1481928 RepID=UPI000782AAFB|nr:hypothetical protein [Bacillus sp. JCM 19034]